MAERKQNSFGTCHHNPKGIANVYNTDKYVLDKSRQFYLFDIIPMGAVRMSQSDKWKTNPDHPDPKKRQRKAVAKYWAFKNLLVLQAKQMNFTLGKQLDAVFFIPMPDSWSEKKKENLNGKPCMSRPDLDNYIKAFLDALKKEDGDVWSISAKKHYAYRGSILIFT